MSCGPRPAGKAFVSGCLRRALGSRPLAAARPPFIAPHVRSVRKISPLVTRPGEGFLLTLCGSTRQHQLSTRQTRYSPYHGPKTRSHTARAITTVSAAATGTKTRTDDARQEVAGTIRAPA